MALAVEVPRSSPSPATAAAAVGSAARRRHVGVEQRLVDRARPPNGDLIALEATDFAQGSFATDHGPYMGVFARTSSDRGASWSAPVRVSQAGRHADRAALAVSGGSTYAAWVTQQSYDNYDPSKPRVLYFRANTGGGWGKTVALTKKKGRVDAPSIAASGKHVYVAWIDANTGQVRVARSTDGGKTFARTVIGKTTALSPDNDGLRGSASIGAAGNAVAVAWIASGSGAVKARVSTNGGKKWHDPISVVGSLGAANGGTPVAPRLGRQARARLDDARRRPRGSGRSRGVPIRTIASFGQSAPYKGGFDVEIVPSQGGTLGAVWSGCRTSGCDLLSARPASTSCGAIPTDGARLVRALAGAGLRPCRPGDQRVADGRLAGRRHADRGLHGPQLRLDELRHVPSRRLVTHGTCRKTLEPRNPTGLSWRRSLKARQRAPC